ncbi:RNA-directed DNA polymerase [Caerostris darwini]|uniref:RNA-directed DNA polymerase n=1 Tax=Caerostris darwini TaxID=1538125 RepID=A0AAV4R234_9ARAC|nr:RNA-directed DNA polymerase [Caerostris darwini]
MEHDQHLNNFLNAAKKYNLCLNVTNCVFSSISIRLLGYIIENKTIKSDPGKLTPLMNLPILQTMKSLKRAEEMFAHYCRWIPKFSLRIHPVLDIKFPLSKNSGNAFESLKVAAAVPR